MIKTVRLSNHRTDRRPNTAELVEQTINAPVADAEAVAAARWFAKREAARRLADKMDREYARVTGADGVTRWFDVNGSCVARSLTPAEESAEMGRINIAIDAMPAKPRPRRSGAVWMRLALALIALACSIYVFVVH